MTDNTEVARLAEGLTGKQQRVLLFLSAEFKPAYNTIDLSRQAIAILASRRSDLVEREWQDGCASCIYYRLTPLGLAVRAYLLSNEVERG